MSVLIAQISDTHVLDPTSDEERWVDNNRRLAQAVRSLNDERPAPAAVLATGDLVNDGAPGELAELASRLDAMTREVDLDGVVALAPDILAGQVKGRVVGACR